MGDEHEPTDADIEVLLRASTSHDAWEVLERFAGTTSTAKRGGELVGSNEVGTAADGQPVLSMPFVNYAGEVTEVLDALYAVGAIVPFDWQTWTGGDLYPDGSGLERAPVADAARITTRIVRGDRFCEGMLDAALRDGSLALAVARLVNWRSGEE